MELTNYNKDKKLRKKPTVDIGSIMFGKVPPQAKELEEAVLGAILIEKSAFDIVHEILKPECFYVDAHSRIFSAMINLAARNMPIDLLLVVEELKRTEELDLVGGPYFVTKLTNQVVSAANVDAHSRIILQCHMKRKIIQAGGEMVQLAYDDSTDVFDLIDMAEASIVGVNSGIQHNYVKVEQGLVAVIQRIEDLRHSDKELTGITTGFTELDRMTCGWQAPDLIVLAARPSVGKTAFAINLGMNAAKTGVGVGFFSLEMSKEQLMQRMLAIESQLRLEEIVRGKLSDSAMKDLYKLGVQPVSALPFFIDDTPAINIFELRTKCRKLTKAGCGLIIVDYLQLMSGVQNSRADNREQEISKISRDLKGLAKELRIPIIALSQLSRAVESRAGEKMPILSDLRESGAIEQDADIVMFMYRPEYYGKHANELGDSTQGETHIKFAKNRQGALDTVKLQANLAIQKFFDYGGSAAPGPVNFKPLIIQKGSKMVDGEQDDDMPF